MFEFIQQWRNRRIIQQSTIKEVEWDSAFAQLQLLAGVTPDEKQRLRELAILFLHQKKFSGAHDLVVTVEMKLTVALQACLPILNLGLRAYKNWVTIIIYPAAFVPERLERDEFGVEHVVRTDLAGEAWLRGPVILSWDDTREAGAIDGANLVIHEFAHKLDMQNGAADGFPPLHREMSNRSWTRLMSAAFEDLQRCCEAGIDVGIDCYAATSPAEYFAVISEVFFERPELLQRRYPQVYELFLQYYRQDPLQRLGSGQG